jgi:hypothetical protein
MPNNETIAGDNMKWFVRIVLIVGGVTFGNWIGKVLMRMGIGATGDVVGMGVGVGIVVWVALRIPAVKRITMW